jgi:hypothetical protein
MAKTGVQTGLLAINVAGPSSMVEPGTVSFTTFEE